MSLIRLRVPLQKNLIISLLTSCPPVPLGIDLYELVSASHPAIVKKARYVSDSAPVTTIYLAPRSLLVLKGFVAREFDDTLLT